MSQESDNKEVHKIHKMMDEMQLDFEEVERKLMQSVSPFEECEVLQIELEEAKKKKVELNKRIKVLENLVKALQEMDSGETKANAVKIAQLEKENAELREENIRLKLAAEKIRNKKKAKGSSKKVNVDGKELQKSSQLVQTRLDGLISANYSHFRLENGEGSPVRQQRSTKEEFEKRVQDYLAGLPEPEPKPEPEEAEKVEPVVLPIYPSKRYYEEVAKRLPAWRMEFEIEFGDTQTEKDKEG